MGLIIACLQIQGQATSLKTSTISGMVSDKKNNEPIPFANIVLFEKNQQVAITQSDFNGKYSFKDIEYGTYKLKATYLGQEIESLKLILSRPKQTQNLSISTSTVLEEVVVYAEPVITGCICRIGCEFGNECFRNAQISEKTELPKIEEKKCNMSVYPNPSYGDITVDVDEPGKEMLIYNLKGEMIYTQNVLDEYNGSIHNLSSSGAGIYIVKYGSGEDQCTQKIVVRSKNENSIGNNSPIYAYY